MLFNYGWIEGVGKCGSRETAGGIIHALAHLGDQPFLLVNSDVWCEADLRPWVAAIRERSIQTATMPSTSTPSTSTPSTKIQSRWRVRLMLVDNPNHHPQGDFQFDPVSRQLVVNGGIRLTYAGIGIYDPTLFASLPSGKQPLAPLLRQWIGDGSVTGEHFTGFWCDVGTPERLKWVEERVGSG